MLLHRWASFVAKRRPEDLRPRLARAKLTRTRSTSSEWISALRSKHSWKANCVFNPLGVFAILLHISREFSSSGAPPEQANADEAEDERSSRLIAGGKVRHTKMAQPLRRAVRRSTIFALSKEPKRHIYRILKFNLHNNCYSTSTHPHSRS